MITIFLPICTRCGKQPDEFITYKKHPSVHVLAMEAGWRPTVSGGGRWQCPQCRRGKKEDKVVFKRGNTFHRSRFRRSK